MAEAAVALACPQCGLALGSGQRACPSCHALVYADRLRELAGEAQEAERRGDEEAALMRWRESLSLLPPGTRQAEAIGARVQALSPAATAGPSAPSNRKKKVGGLAGIGTAILVGLSKLKFLLLGLTKLGTLLSMIAFFGVYWAAFGWQWAGGLVLSIYVHEMGHVAALRRVGLPATAPMFIPGFGALVRLKGRPASAREDAYIGLAGPWWGLGAAVAWALAFHLTGSKTLLAIAGVGAWINLFNLVPVWQLDGSRGFSALSRPYRLIVAAACGGLFATLHLGMVGLIALVAAYRALFTPAPAEHDGRALASFLGLIGLLSALTWFAMQRVSLGL